MTRTSQKMQTPRYRLNVKNVSRQSSRSEDDSSSGKSESESTSSSSTSGATNSAIYYSAGRMYLPPETWKDVPVKTVNQLPSDINGLCKYQLKFNINKRMESSRDGRQWQRYVPSKRRGHSGIRRLAKCKGSYCCENPHCDFMMEYNQPNRHHFKVKENKAKCEHCGCDGLFVNCNARKIWEFNDTLGLVTVFHYGDHSCQPSPKHTPSTDKVITDMFKKNPKLKPSQVSINCVVQAISDDKTWDEISEVCESVANDKNNRNLKKKAVREGNVHGHSFEAVGVLKQKTDNRDPHLIHKINDRRLNGNPSYVFKTSSFKAKMCMSMDRNGNKLMCKEYCHFDGKVNRCTGFTTLTASVYHPTLKKMVKLAVMEAEGESEQHVNSFWKELNVVIRKVSGNPEASFNPYGFMLDEAGGIWKSIKNNFSDDVLKNSVSCEFHFLQNVNRHTSNIANDNEKRGYKKLAKQMMDSASPPAYFETLNILENFIHRQNENKEKLLNWLHWWDNRRIYTGRKHLNVI